MLHGHTVMVGNEAWRHTVVGIIEHGQRRSLAKRPGQARSEETLELVHHTLAIDMKHPVLTVKDRKLGYKFLAAEALWILNGDDRVESIAPYSKEIASFSDDGVTFFGAYGPRILAQKGYVVGKLCDDERTRQATLTIWRPSPPATKDYPCTIAMDFKIVGRELNCHVFMRSSDAWLGLPYDMFNFSMVAAAICKEVNLCSRHAHGLPQWQLGTLYLTMASSHLYERDMSTAIMIHRGTWGEPVGAPVPQGFYQYHGPDDVLAQEIMLQRLKAGDLEARWWVT